MLLLKQLLRLEIEDEGFLDPEDRYACEKVNIDGYEKIFIAIRCAAASAPFPYVEEGF